MEGEVRGRVFGLAIPSNTCSMVSPLNRSIPVPPSRSLRLALGLRQADPLQPTAPGRMPRLRAVRLLVSFRMALCCWRRCRMLLQVWRVWGLLVSAPLSSRGWQWGSSRLAGRSMLPRCIWPASLTRVVRLTSNMACRPAGGWPERLWCRARPRTGSSVTAAGSGASRTPTRRSRTAGSVSTTSGCCCPEHAVRVVGAAGPRLC
jgi:hypothetical protein